MCHRLSEHHAKVYCRVETPPLFMVYVLLIFFQPQHSVPDQYVVLWCNAQSGTQLFRLHTNIDHTDHFQKYMIVTAVST